MAKPGGDDRCVEGGHVHAHDFSEWADSVMLRATGIRHSPNTRLLLCAGTLLQTIAMALHEARLERLMHPRLSKTRD